MPEARVPPRYSDSIKKPELLYESVSKTVIDKIYSLYEDDFRLFGYTPDDAKQVANGPLSKYFKPTIA